MAKGARTSNGAEHENNGGDICSILFSDEKSEGQKKISLISYLNSGNNIYEEFKRGSKLMETIVGNDFLSGLELVIPSIMHDYNVLHQLFFYGLDFSSIKCLNYLKSRINKEDIRRHVNLNDLCVEGKIESLKLVLEFMSDQLVQKDVCDLAVAAGERTIPRSHTNCRSHKRDILQHRLRRHLPHAFDQCVAQCVELITCAACAC